MTPHINPFSTHTYPFSNALRRLRRKTELPQELTTHDRKLGELINAAESETNFNLKNKLVEEIIREYGKIGYPKQLEKLARENVDFQISRVEKKLAHNNFVTQEDIRHIQTALKHWSKFQEHEPGLFQKRRELFHNRFLKIHVRPAA